MPEPLILVHGGAGLVPAESRELHAEGCANAAKVGGAVLNSGGSALDAVCAAVESLEDNPIYNSGTGCALTYDGGVSLDSSVMCGKTHRAGGVACLGPFRNPVRIAQCLLEEETILLAGVEAERWAEAKGFERLQEDDLIVPSAAKAWKRVVQEGGACNWAGGTVGAVARDSDGDLAAATSTGGTMGKLPGRVGDSPLIGVGTYADEICAVSATGNGEAFMRAVFAARVADRIRRGEEPSGAIQNVLNRIEREFRGNGGAIVVPKEGDFSAVKNTTTMSYGWWSPEDSGADC